MNQPLSWLHYWAWYYLGHCYAALNRFEDSFVAYMRAVQLFPERAEAWIAQGMVHRNLGEYDRAVPFFSAASSLKKPENIGFCQEEDYNGKAQENLSFCLEKINV
jgi:tetratricopeptide (TPR) repeat protein